MEFVVAMNDPLFSTLHQQMDDPDEGEKAISAPSLAYVRDRKAMARTPTDVKELPNAYVFEVDVPRIRCEAIKVQVEDRKMLVISAERKPDEKEKEVGVVKYLRMERRMGKFMRKFPLPDNANDDTITGTCKDGVLTVTVEKVLPPEPKKPRTIEVQVA